MDVHSHSLMAYDSQAPAFMRSSGHLTPGASPVSQNGRQTTSAHLDAGRCDSKTENYETPSHLGGRERCLDVVTEPEPRTTTADKNSTLYSSLPLRGPPGDCASKKPRTSQEGRSSLVQHTEETYLEIRGITGPGTPPICEEELLHHRSSKIAARVRFHDKNHGRSSKRHELEGNPEITSPKDAAMAGVNLTPVMECANNSEQAQSTTAMETLQQNIAKQSATITEGVALLQLNDGPYSTNDCSAQGGAALPTSDDREGTSNGPGKGKGKRPGTATGYRVGRPRPLVEKKPSKTKNQDGCKRVCCPFERNDPEIHCGKHRNICYENISRLRQHLQRAHFKSFQCSCNHRCGSSSLLKRHAKNKDGCKRNFDAVPTDEELAAVRFLDNNKRLSYREIWILVNRFKDMPESEFCGRLDCQHRDIEALDEESNWDSDSPVPTPSSHDQDYNETDIVSQVTTGSTGIKAAENLRGQGGSRMQPSHRPFMEDQNKWSIQDADCHGAQKVLPKTATQILEDRSSNGQRHSSGLPPRPDINIQNLALRNKPQQPALYGTQTKPVNSYLAESEARTTTGNAKRPLAPAHNRPTYPLPETEVYNNPGLNRDSVRYGPVGNIQMQNFSSGSGIDENGHYCPPNTATRSSEYSPYQVPPPPPMTNNFASSHHTSGTASFESGAWKYPANLSGTNTIPAGEGWSFGTSLDESAQLPTGRYREPGGLPHNHHNYTSSPLNPSSAQGPPANLGSALQHRSIDRLRVSEHIPQQYNRLFEPPSTDTPDHDMPDSNNICAPDYMAIWEQHTTLQNIEKQSIGQGDVRSNAFFRGTLAPNPSVLPPTPAQSAGTPISINDYPQTPVYDFGGAEHNQWVPVSLDQDWEQEIPGRQQLQQQQHQQNQYTNTGGSLFDTYR